MDFDFFYKRNLNYKIFTTKLNWLLQCERYKVPLGWQKAMIILKSQVWVQNAHRHFETWPVISYFFLQMLWLCCDELEHTKNFIHRHHLPIFVYGLFTQRRGKWMISKLCLWGVPIDARHQIALRGIAILHVTQAKVKV